VKKSFDREGHDLVIKDLEYFMIQQLNEDLRILKNSLLYKEFVCEREEILRHKWLESEKAGQDIGFEKALLDWVIKYRSAWRKNRQPQTGAPQFEGRSN
jgi:hypothetical protein